MIKKEDCEKALATVQAYNEQLNLQIVRPMTCCKCEKEIIKPLYPEKTKPLEQECGWWEDGTVEKISFGYGSLYDTQSYYISICDDCLTKLRYRGLATSMEDIEKQISTK